MTRFNALVLALLVGIVLGTVLRPGLIEIAIIGALILVIANAARSRRRRAERPVV